MDRPNILFIMTDQHRADLMTCAGRDLVPTPNIDRIAACGVRFTRGYCPYPVSLASRSAMLNGLYAHHTGAINNSDRLDWRYRTFAHHFADCGYLTGLIGKMHFNDAHNHGFDYYLSINDWLMYLGPKVRHYANEIGNHPLNPHFFKTVDDDGAGFPDLADLWDGPSPWVGNIERFGIDDPDFRYMASALEPEDHLDTFIARESIEFMRRYQDQPFLLVASFMKPHTPFYAPREYAERYPIDDAKLSPPGDISGYPEHIQNRIRNTLGQSEKRRRAHLAGYLGNLSFADVCVGLLYDGLEELDLLDNTIVVYTSDHGEMLGDHGIFQKFCLFEPAVQVPLIVSHPGHIPQDRVCDALIEQIGLYPTLADLAGIDPPSPPALVDFPEAPEKIDGISFADLARDPDLEGLPAAFSEYNLRNAGQYMIRADRYKYIFNYGAKNELYDHETDPGENVNIVDHPEMKEIVAELRDQLFTWYDPETNPYQPDLQK